jgi:precorrin-6B methylase 2
MNHNRFKKVFIWLFFMVSCFPLLGQEKDSLTLPREVRLNERQPPDLILKTIGIEPGMIIGEVGAGRGRYTVHIASRIGPTGMIYANDIVERYLQAIEKRCAEHGLTKDNIYILKQQLPLISLHSPICSRGRQRWREIIKLAHRLLSPQPI